MADDPHPADDRAMSAAERGLLVLLLAVVAILGAVWLTRAGGWRDAELTRSAHPPGDYADPGANRLDPNTASWQSLARLPGVGESKAKAVVAYRAAWPGPGPAFAAPRDLARVPGIGPKIAARIGPLLVFPPPTTAPDTLSDR